MLPFGLIWFHAPVAEKGGTRWPVSLACDPSFKKHTRRYKEVIAPAKVLEGLKNLTKKRRYANRHG